MHGQLSHNNCQARRKANNCRAPKREANKRRTGEVLFDLGVRTYVYLSVTLGKDRHIHIVMLGKDRHIHIRVYACAHWQC